MLLHNSLLLNFRDHQVDTPRTSTYIVLSLLLALLLPASLAWATPSKQPSWQKNMKVGLELRWGAPYGWALKEEDLEECGEHIKKINSNWQFGPVVGYHFPVYDKSLAIGPDIGLLMSSKRECEASRYFACINGNRRLSMQERYLHVPLALKLALFDQETGVQESGLALGYEFRVLLSSQLSRVGGNSNPEIQSYSKETGDIAKSMKLGGSLFLEGKVDLLQGCYLAGRFKFPIIDSLALKKADEGNDDKRRVLHAIRVLNESLVEISIGINIMKWFSFFS